MNMTPEEKLQEKIDEMYSEEELVQGQEQYYNYGIAKAKEIAAQFLREKAIDFFVRSDDDNAKKYRALADELIKYKGFEDAKK